MNCIIFESSSKYYTFFAGPSDVAHAPMEIIKQKYLDSIIRYLVTLEDNPEIKKYLEFGKLPPMIERKKILKAVDTVVKIKDQDLRNVMRRNFVLIRDTIQNLKEQNV